MTTRRRFLEIATGALAAAAAPRSATARVLPEPSGEGTAEFERGPTGARVAYVGAFTSKARNAHGEGLAVFRVDQTSGRWARIQLLAGEINPSFLAVDARGRALYAVHADTDQVSAFAIDARSGELALMNRQSTGGANPVHLAIDPTGRFLVVADYATGGVAVVPINTDGSLGARSDLVKLSGEPGPHRTEQSASHPHHCPFDARGRFIVVPDKGLDRVYVFRLDGARGTLVPAKSPFVKTRAGAGPRHAGFHPRLPFAYVINELDSTIAMYRIGETGALDPMQIVPSIPATFTGDNTGSEIVVSPSGRYVYGSNRGHDSIGVFRIDERTGMLSSVGWEPTRGAGPRFIGLGPAGARMYAANQGSDSIVEFDADRESGALHHTGLVVPTGTPVCLVWR
jgi:6-phosphogluconolactonase